MAAVQVPDLQAHHFDRGALRGRSSASTRRNGLPSSTRCARANSTC